MTSKFFLLALNFTLLLGTPPSLAVTTKSFIGFKGTGFVPGSIPGSTTATLCAYTRNPPAPTTTLSFLGNINIIPPIPDSPPCLIRSEPFPGLKVTDLATIETHAFKPAILQGGAAVGGAVISSTTSTSPAGGSTTSEARAFWTSLWPNKENPQSFLSAFVEVVKNGSSPPLGAASALSDDPYLDLMAGIYPFNITFALDPNLSSLDPITPSSPLELLNESTSDITFVSAEGLIGRQGEEPYHPIWRLILAIYPDKSLFLEFFADPNYINLISPTSTNDVKNSLSNVLDTSVAGSVKINNPPYQLFAAELNSSQNFSYSEKASAYIVPSSVPSPFPLVGVAVAFKLSRRLRARVRIRDGCMQSG